MIESTGKYYDRNKGSVQLLKHWKKIALSLFVTKMDSGSLKTFVSQNLQLLANAVKIDSDSSSSINALLQSEICLLSYWCLTTTTEMQRYVCWMHIIQTEHK